MSSNAQINPYGHNQLRSLAVTCIPTISIIICLVNVMIKLACLQKVCNSFTANTCAHVDLTL